ncbi:hypothetical protein SAMN04489761_3469 [Tenacibaculum sp. MAR_2009_124]|nr:hypothetical protein [Tenacibaculum sp. MAR_2009_124]SEC67419.1 hypothetical protein SAMN04489761_3469 [Tenacibaculum sp. MAR_2009_124]
MPVKFKPENLIENIQYNTWTKDFEKALTSPNTPINIIAKKFTE